MPRLHLVELEDLPWFPGVIRDLATDYLHFIETKLSLHAPAVKLLGDALRESGATHVVDLCSGGGGPILALQRDLAAQGQEVTHTLTDRYPNLPAFQAVAGQCGAITYEREAVDALNVPERLCGFRTLFNGFHHFAPPDAKAVLQDAVRAGQPIGVFEIIERTPATILSMVFLTPLMVWLATPGIRPFRWHRLFWTYVIPAVPFTCWWDGVVSSFRAYHPEELEALAESLPENGYRWEAGKVPVGTTPASMTYLIGYPQSGG